MFAGPINKLSLRVLLRPLRHDPIKFRIRVATFFRAYEMLDHPVHLLALKTSAKQST